MWNAIWNGIWSKGLIRIDDKKNEQEISLLQIVTYNNTGLLPYVSEIMLKSSGEIWYSNLFDLLNSALHPLQYLLLRIPDWALPEF